jgi:hypothetical protein
MSALAVAALAVGLFLSSQAADPSSTTRHAQRRCPVRAMRGRSTAMPGMGRSGYAADVRGAEGKAKVSANMSRYKPKLSEEGWIANVPELMTRPVLLSALKSHGKLRHRFFQVQSHLESVALIPDRHLAAYCLTLYWRDTRRMLYRYWHDRLREETGTDVLFNEFFGCLFNVRKNMILKCGIRFESFSQHDVKREYRER